MQIALRMLFVKLFRTLHTIPAQLFGLRQACISYSFFLHLLLATGCFTSTLTHAVNAGNSNASVNQSAHLGANSGPDQGSGTKSAMSALAAPSKASSNASQIPASTKGANTVVTGVNGVNGVNTSEEVAAIVNGIVISKSDIDDITARNLQGVTDPRVIRQVRIQALNDLINEYLAQAAFEQTSISKDARAAKQLERLKRQVVFNYYLSSQLSDLPKPDLRKIEAYLNKHPELSSGRQKYHFVQLMIEAHSTMTLPQVQQVITQDPSLGTLINILQSQKLSFARNDVWRSSDELTPEMLKQLNALKPGTVNTQLVTNQTSIEVLKLLAVLPDPITMAEASTKIQGYAQDELRNRLARDLINKLRAKANIQIVDQSLTPSEANDNLANAGVGGANASHAQEVSVAFESGSSSVFAYVLTIWYFALVLMAPVALIVFYRQRMVIQKPSNMSLDELMDPEYASYVRHTILIRRLIVIPFLLLITYVMCLPLLDFFRNPPAGIGIRIIAMLAIAGILSGAAVIFAGYRFTPIKQRLKSGWLGLIAILVIQGLLFWFDVHA